MVDAITPFGNDSSHGSENRHVQLQPLHFEVHSFNSYVLNCHLHHTNGTCALAHGEKFFQLHTCGRVGMNECHNAASGFMGTLAIHLLVNAYRTNAYGTMERSTTLQLGKLTKTHISMVIFSIANCNSQYQRVWLVFQNLYGLMTIQMAWIFLCADGFESRGKKNKKNCSV